MLEIRYCGGGGGRHNVLDLSFERNLTKKSFVLCQMTPMVKNILHDDR